MYKIESEIGEKTYLARLVETDSGKFRWALCFHRLNNVEVMNREWRTVGRDFATQKSGGSYLGWGDQGQINRNNNNNVSEHLHSLVDEYEALYSDEIMLRGGKRMGRPSQGRSVRLQPMVTPELASWLEAQSEHDGKSVSDTVFRLLEQARGQGSVQRPTRPTTSLDDVADAIQSVYEQ